MSVNTVPDIHNIIICANMFIKRDGRLLVIRRSDEKQYMPGFIQPVGGKVKLSEDPLQAAKRELFEEAGLNAANIRLEAVLTDVHKEGINNWQVFHFSGDYLDGDTIATDEGELLWLTPEEIKKEKVLDSIVRIVNQIFIPNHGILFAKYMWGEEDSSQLIEQETLL